MSDPGILISFFCIDFLNHNTSHLIAQSFTLHAHISPEQLSISLHLATDHMHQIDAVDQWFHGKLGMH